MITISDFEDVWLEAKEGFDETVEEFYMDFYRPFIDNKAAQMYAQLEPEGKQRLAAQVLTADKESQEQFAAETPSVWKQLKEVEDGQKQ